MEGYIVVKYFPKDNNKTTSYFTPHYETTEEEREVAESQDNYLIYIIDCSER